MNPIIKSILLINVMILVVIVFVYPHLMVSPGKVIESHHTLETDCFACHTLFTGASSEKCATCHKVEDIGIRSSKGVPLVKKKPSVAFHQGLLEKDCVACHSDHVGVAVYRMRQPFSHQLLANESNKQCNVCHSKPVDNLHKPLSKNCNLCHVTDKWKPASFKHSLLPRAELENCVSCHKNKTPADKYHRQASDKCGTCHTTEKWKPASFNHNKYFVLDGKHRRCKMCHRTPDYKQYSCYACHEHSPEEVKEKHLKEGIRDFENCVACHRSADEDEAERAWESLQRGIPYNFGLPLEQVD